MRRQGVEWWSDDKVAVALGARTKVKLGWGVGVGGENARGKGDGSGEDIARGRYALWIESEEGGERVEMKGLPPGRGTSE